MPSRHAASAQPSVANVRSDEKFQAQAPTMELPGMFAQFSPDGTRLLRHDEALT
jgi:hypothetical protein